MLKKKKGLWIVGWSVAFVGMLTGTAVLFHGMPFLAATGQSQSADIYVSPATCAHDVSKPGSYRYMFTIGNKGPATATGVSGSLEVSGAFIVPPILPLQDDNTAPIPVVLSSPTLATWSNGTLSAGDSVMHFVDIEDVSEKTGFITVKWNSPLFDPDLSNNVLTTVTTGTECGGAMPPPALGSCCRAGSPTCVHDVLFTACPLGDPSVKLFTGYTSNLQDRGKEQGLCNVACGQIFLQEHEWCGNGKRETNEGCDDGNTANGDGCSSTCTVESREAAPVSGPNSNEKVGLTPENVPGSAQPQVIPANNPPANILGSNIIAGNSVTVAQVVQQMEDSAHFSVGVSCSLADPPSAPGQESASPSVNPGNSLYQPSSHAASDFVPMAHGCGSFYASFPTMKKDPTKYNAEGYTELTFRILGLSPGTQFVNNTYAAFEIKDHSLGAGKFHSASQTPRVLGLKNEFLSNLKRAKDGTYTVKLVFNNEELEPLAFQGYGAGAPQRYVDMVKGSIGMVNFRFRLGISPGWVEGGSYYSAVTAQTAAQCGSGSAGCSYTPDMLAGCTCLFGYNPFLLNGVPTCRGSNLSPPRPANCKISPPTKKPVIAAPTEHVVTSVFSKECKAVNLGPGFQSIQHPGNLHTLPRCADDVFTIESKILVPKEFEGDEVSARLYVPPDTTVDTPDDISIRIGTQEVFCQRTNSCDISGIKLYENDIQGRFMVAYVALRINASAPSEIFPKPIEILLISKKNGTGKKIILPAPHSVTVLRCQNGTPSLAPSLAGSAIPLLTDPALIQYTAKLNEALSQADTPQKKEQEFTVIPLAPQQVVEELKMTAPKASGISNSASDSLKPGPSPAPHTLPLALAWMIGVIVLSVGAVTGLWMYVRRHS